MPLSEVLKEQTKTSHQLLEKKIIERIKKIAAPKDYAQLLQLFYGYFGGLEQRINAVIEKDMLLDYGQRRKASLLADDLAALDATIPKKAAEKDLPLIETNAQAFAALYVIEGSVLGGPHIVKMIAPRLHLTGEKGFLFFNGYGSDTMLMWQGFKNALDALPAADNIAITVIETANEVFDYFSRWIDNH